MQQKERHSYPNHQSSPTPRRRHASHESRSHSEAGISAWLWARAFLGRFATVSRRFRGNQSLHRPQAPYSTSQGNRSQSQVARAIATLNNGNFSMKIQELWYQMNHSQLSRIPFHLQRNQISSTITRMSFRSLKVMKIWNLKPRRYKTLSKLPRKM